MNKDMIVYLTLLLCGIVFAIVALFSMMTGPDYFSIIFAAYMLGYSIYMTVMLFKYRASQSQQDQNQNQKIDTPIWVTLFTVFLSILLAGMAFVMCKRIGSQASSSGPAFIYPNNNYRSI